MNHQTVSCVCPTTGTRQLLLVKMLDCFQAQDYPKIIELIILTDKPLFSVLPRQDGRVKLFTTPHPMNIPQKRNWLTRMAKGDIIIHFDDDDWSAPGRVRNQVRTLNQYGVGFTGFHSLLFWDEVQQQAFRYVGSPGYACGTSFCYTRTTGLRFPFPESQDLGSDNGMVYRLRDKNLVATDDGGQMMVARIHTQTSNFKNTKGENYVPIKRETLPEGFWT